MDDTKVFLSQLHGWVTDLGLQAIAALLLFLVGIQVARFLRRTVNRAMQRAHFDATLILFASNILYVVTLILTTIAALGQLGVQTASFIAVLGSAGITIGLALQGSLTNFAAGILIIIFRPFKVGDFIEGAGISGFVEEIQLLTTTLKTADNRTVIIPHRKLFEDHITNYSAKNKRRVDLTFVIPVQQRIDRAKQVILDVLKSDRRILQDPFPQVGVLDWSEAGIRFAVRPWVNTKDYWEVYFDLQETMKERFDAEGLLQPKTEG
ncbi:MAG: mechanosensitive ion channel [Oculatellaceae cyanobacterium Prado106]|jgi:small conductance mechanosensitive channel|nr:mechanosensitive ion channel [Oculatellaceae cyanobacterium Prado106]